METIIYAARTIIYQRDYRAENGHYDETEPNPEAGDQCFDDWAADILEQALRTEGIATCDHDWGGPASYGAECVRCGTQCEERINADGSPLGVDCSACGGRGCDECDGAGL